MKVEGDLLAHVAHNSEGHVVEEFRACRPNKQSHRHDMLGKWRGLDESENTWDPVTQLNEDIPTTLWAYALRHREDPVVQDIINESKLSFGEVLGPERIRV